MLSVNFSFVYIHKIVHNAHACIKYDLTNFILWSATVHLNKIFHIAWKILIIMFIFPTLQMNTTANLYGRQSGRHTPLNLY